MDVRYYIEHSYPPPPSPIPSSNISLETPPSEKKTGRIQQELDSHELKQTQVSYLANNLNNFIVHNYVVTGY